MSALQSLNVLLIDETTAHARSRRQSCSPPGIRRIRGNLTAALEALRMYDVDLAIVGLQHVPAGRRGLHPAIRNSPDSTNPYLPIIMMTAALRNPSP
jgi:hypothetical protein